MSHLYSSSINQTRIVQFEFWRFFHRLCGAPVWWWPSSGHPMKHSPKFKLYNPSLVYTVEVEMKLGSYIYVRICLFKYYYSCQQSVSHEYQNYFKSFFEGLSELNFQSTSNAKENIHQMFAIILVIPRTSGPFRTSGPLI